MRLLIAGGGTGGHIYPALAVARWLRDRPDAPELAWLGGHRGLEAELVPPAGIPLRRLALRSLRSAGRDVHLVLDPLRLAASVPQAATILARERPAAILSTGGYVAIPTLVAARTLGIPSLLWEGNVIPGRSVRAMARFASVVAVSFGSTCETLAVAHCYVTGTPIRDTTAVDRVAARARLDIPPGARLLLVFGGSQAVRRLNDAVSSALPELVQRIHVLHVSGTDGYARALGDRERLPADQRARYRPAPFLREEMLDALAAADLVVGRAGSSTLAEVTAFGLPMVVVPYPHAAGHQGANARVLVEAGAARIVRDEDFDAAALVEAAGLLDDAPAHLAMSAAARSLGRPGAAAAVGELLLALATRSELPSAERLDAVARAGAG